MRSPSCARDERHGHPSLPSPLAGLRDRALLSVMLYSFARMSAVLGMRRQDYEKGGKRHDAPAHHRAAAGDGDHAQQIAGHASPKTTRSHLMVIPPAPRIMFAQEWARSSR